MEQYKPSYAAVIVAGIAMWVLGAVWYNVLGSAWMSYTGITEEMASMMTGMDMVLMYGGSVIAFALVFYVQDHLMFQFKAADVKGALQSGFWSWLGFIATSFFIQNLYQMKPFGLWLIDAGYWLVGLIVGSIILVKMGKKTAAAPAA